MRMAQTAGLSKTNMTPSRHLLVFTVDKEAYAVDISIVQGIQSYQVTSMVKNCPNYIKGVLKIQKNFSLVVDLRILFNITPVIYNDFTLMIILNIKNHLYSIVIDQVLDVFPLVETEIMPASDLSALVARHYIQGVLNFEERLLILLDIEKLFSEELTELSQQTPHYDQSI